MTIRMRAWGLKYDEGMSLNLPDVERLSLDDVLTKRRRFVRELRAAGAGRPLRIAVLGGSTTNELVDFLELHPAQQE